MPTVQRGAKARSSAGCGEPTGSSGLAADSLNDSMLDGLPGSADRVGDGAGVRAPVADDADAVDAQQGGASYGFVVGPPLDAPQGGGEQGGGNFEERVRVDLLLHEVDQQFRRALPHLQDDVPHEPVADNDVHAAQKDV